MEITCSNFNNVLPEIEKAIENSLFVSLDCELSGLNIARNINAYDTPREYYKKMKVNSKDFLVMQYGLSTFRYDHAQNKFRQRTYNFYIFRRPAFKKIPDDRFLCQSSCIDFLINHSFDFNKLFKEGLPYLNKEEEEKNRAYVEQCYKKALDEIENRENDTLADPGSIPEKAEKFMEDIKAKIQAFLKSNETELELPKCNSYLRRLVYQAKDSNSLGKIYLETRQIENDRILFVTRLKSPEEQRVIAKKKYEERLQELDDCIGFTKVLKLLVKYDKLIIGHNLCLDFFHTIKFLIPLPESYEEFKQISHSLFSKVLDTKYMASNVSFKDLIPSTVLVQLLETVSKKPFGLPETVVEETGRGYAVDDHKEHEAGYDAFITGLCFLGMWKHLGLLDNKSDAATFGNMDLLEPYINKLFLMKLMDNQYLYLSGDELIPPREHVFFITFPKQWELMNIQQLFSPFGNIFVSWIDDTSAYVALHKKDLAKMAFTSLKKSDVYTLKTFDSRQAQILARDTQEEPSRSSLLTGRKRKSSDSPTPSKSRKADESDSPICNSSKNGGNAMYNALLKMSIETDSMLDEDSDNSTKDRIFKEDDDWS